jgi:hypothetical protein
MADNEVIELNFDEILTLIQGQLLEYMNAPENYEKYKNFKIVLSKEQQFMKLKDKDPNAIYIVVKFGAAEVVFGQTVLPATIMALTEQNRIESAYSLFYEYAQKYNLQRVSDDMINQVYESPSISGGFNVVYEGYRSAVVMSAAFVIGKNSNEYKVYYYYTDENGKESAEEVPQMSASFSFILNPDTQAFYNSNDFARSVIGFGSVTIGFTTFVLSDCHLINDILDILGTVDETGGYLTADDGSQVPSAYTNNTSSMNKTFKLGVIYRDKKHARIKDYKLSNAVGSQEVGQIPTISLAFTE